MTLGVGGVAGDDDAEEGEVDDSNRRLSSSSSSSIAASGEDTKAPAEMIEDTLAASTGLEREMTPERSEDAATFEATDDVAMFAAEEAEVIFEAAATLEDVFADAVTLVDDALDRAREDEAAAAAVLSPFPT